MSETKNKLAEELSPYLLQHKNNPVHWYGFNEEAFELALKFDKPIFLSIGYSTCHWCHVMEHESFEDEEVAHLMNEAFINIKVDREERPDVDHLYMSVCQMMTGQGGWPLTVIMTPDKRPFFAGTYFPKYSRGQQPGMLDLITYIKKVWIEERDNVLDSANNIMVQLVQQNQSSISGHLTEETLHNAFNQIKSNYDSVFGGFGDKPKFPTPHKLNFLLHYYELFKNKDALEMTTETLTKLRLGGIYDQVGNGFHRYSTDKEWLLPHFEKMLYDQAQLIWTYTEAFKLTNDNSYKMIVDEIIDYVVGELSAENGGFYSAEDADSEGVEGKFYIWKNTELSEVLSAKEKHFVIEKFNVLEEGNFFDEASGQKTGENIFFLTEQLNQNDKELWFEIQKKLVKVRKKRVRPGLDDKILTDWNGLMIGALAEAGRLLDNKKYTDLAEKSVSFIEEHLLKKSSVYHRYRNNKVGIKGTAFDYTYLVFGYINLYKATQKVNYLESAKQLNDKAMDLFWDTTSAGFFNSDNDDIIVQQKDSYDGALPSVNGMLYFNLLSLSQLLHDSKLYEKALALNAIFASKLNQYPMAYTFWLTAETLHQEGLPICVIVGHLSEKDYAKLKQHQTLNTVLQKIDPKKDGLEEKLANKGFKKMNNKTTFYVCKNFSCQKPTTSISEALKLLQN
ncbi:MAG: thioredoxin domain-containing protein [Rickettsiales bacterium]|nr:thioredoxin domain-containing protein [Rickettsiales bacterium]|tara:strand:+ start:791 stop:2818 length:2028 start_codon:yes stop_codon:yes gene_type:complete